MRRTLWRTVFVALVLTGAVGLSATVADAHTFLVRSSPSLGARLTNAPGEIVLDFTEPVAAGSTLTIRDGNGTTIAPLSIGPDGEMSRLRASLPELVDGVYQVTWHVVAEDGHTTEGEFVFAIGVDLPPGAVVSTQSSSGPTRWADALAALALLVGLAIAFGGLLSERFVWTNNDPSIRSPLVTAAVAVGLAGALGSVGLALHRANQLLDPAHWADALTTRADHTNVAIAAVLSIALLVVQRQRLRSVALGPVAIAGVLVAVRGHAPDASAWWSTPAAAAHLLVAGAWLGALTQLAMIARRNQATVDTIEPGPSRYAAAAVVAAIATVGIGVVVAISELSRFGDLVDTRYGQILLVKVVLVTAAIGVALLARRRGIPATGARIRSLARYTAIETIILLAVVAASALLSTTAPTAGLGRVELAAAPLPEPTMFTADLAGSHQVLVAAATDRLHITVLPPGGQPSQHQTSTVAGTEPDGASFDLEPRPCGPGCFDIAHHWSNGITHLTVTVTNPDADGGDAQLDIVWPPGPDATDLLTQAVAATRKAGTVTVTETISSGPDATFGPGDLITNGDDYISSSPFSNGADDIYQLPAEDGLTVIAFIVTGTGTWHQLWIDDMYRIRRETLVDPGHRIDRTITYSDQP
ncbi:MAG: copper resistance protein CopC [Ilumatobacteraceae bacterium]